ncbi:MAG: guanylate kinase [Candidatus Nanopelagicales bacterium]
MSRLVVLSGPSGVGKGTVVAAARAIDPALWCSVSATTRQQRPGEVQGVHYYFLTDQAFEDLVESGGFLEWAGYSGHKYGTPKSPVLKRLAAGQSVLLEIDLAGARQIRSCVPEAAMVFLFPPSWTELENRLRGRGTENAAMIARRLARARAEMSAVSEFDQVIVNDEVDKAARALLAIMAAESAELAD